MFRYYYKLIEKGRKYWQDSRIRAEARLNCQAMKYVQKQKSMTDRLGHHLGSRAGRVQFQDGSVAIWDDYNGSYGVVGPPDWKIPSLASHSEK